MTAPYTLIRDLVHQMESPVDGTLSRTIHQDERLKAVLFHFGAGQELSEHTASTPAIIHFLEGDADVTLGGDVVAASFWYVDSYAGSTSSQHSHQDARRHAAVAG